MYQRVGAVAFKKDLTNTIKLCELLGNPQERFRSVHIAGTNGKGSVAHMLAAVYQSTGLKVGIYSSPHLLDFRERIKINGEMISEVEVVEFVERMKPHIGPVTKPEGIMKRDKILKQDEILKPLKQVQGGQVQPARPSGGDDVLRGNEPLEPSFFELTVAMAFECFARHKVDLAMIETGLGGRLDSTNVITPLLSIITNISLEHQQFLGNTLQEIAGEKAGIIKPEVPVVIGERHPETELVFRKKAEACGSEILFAQDHHQVELVSSTVDSITVRSDEHGEIGVGCGAWYQLQNVATVLAAIDTLDKTMPVRQGERVDHKALSQFKQLTHFRGRWDVLSREPLVIADGAHNPAGLQAVFDQLKSLQHNTLRVVFGVVKDKDLDAVLNVLPAHAEYYCCRPDLPRGLDVRDLATNMISKNLNASTSESVAEALDQAINDSSSQDIVFVGGSLFVVAEALAINAAATS